MGGLRTTLRLVLLGGPIFYLFHVCTRWFYYLLTVDMGGAQYRASGRGFIIGDHATTVKTPSHIHLSVPCWCCRARDLPQHVSAVRSITLCSWHGALVRARGPVHPRSHWVRASAPSASALAAAAVSQLTSVVAACSLQPLGQRGCSRSPACGRRSSTTLKVLATQPLPCVCFF